MPKGVYPGNKGKTPWNKGLVGVRKKPDGEVSYSTLHMQVAVKFGKPSECEACGSTAKRNYEWARLTETNSNDRKDWKRMCIPCHRKHDFNKNSHKSNCEHCKEVFVAKIRSRAKFCSNSCRVLNHYYRKK